MSSRCKAKPACFRRDIHGLLLAAEAAQKADILTYSSGHLGPRSLNPSPPHREQKQPFWRTPRGSEETPNPVTPTKALKKKAVKHCPSESSTHTASDVSRSRRAPAADRSSRADITGDKCLPNIDLCSPNSLVLRPRALHQKKSNFPSDLLGKPPSDQKGPSDKGHLKTKQRLGGKVVAKQDLRAGINVAEVHERKLQKELERLSAQSCPGRDRLAVVTDVFDDPVPSDAFQLRESQERRSPWSGKRKWSSHWNLVTVQVISGKQMHDCPIIRKRLKRIDLHTMDLCGPGRMFMIDCLQFLHHQLKCNETEYDMYVNHLMASQPLHQNVSLETSLKGPGSDKVRQTDLEDSEKEVFRLEQEAKGALEENKRARNESKNIPATVGPEDGDTTNASLSGLRDGGLDAGHSTSVRSKRLQVLNTWRENQQLEEELEEMLVSSGTTQRCIKDLKMEIMRLIASNNCLNTTNKDLENNINMVLNRERASKTTRRTLWDEIHCDLQTRE